MFWWNREIVVEHQQTEKNPEITAATWEKKTHSQETSHIRMTFGGRTMNHMSFRCANSSLRTLSGLVGFPHACQEKLGMRSKERRHCRHRAQKLGIKVGEGIGEGRRGRRGYGGPGSDNNPLQG